MNDGIKVKIFKGDGVGADATTQGTDITPESQVSPTAESKSNKNKSDKAGAIAAVVIQQAKQLVLQGVTQYAELSGNQDVTDGLNVILEVGSLGAMLVMGGPVGAIGAAAIVVNKAINVGVSLVKEKRELTFLKQGMGMINTYGNRGDY